MNLLDAVPVAAAFASIAVVLGLIIEYLEPDT